MSEMPKLLNVVYNDGLHAMEYTEDIDPFTKYIRFDEHERIVSALNQQLEFKDDCLNIDKNTIQEKDQEIAKLKEHLQEYTKRISIKELIEHLENLI